MELWVIGQGADYKTSQILAVSLDVDYAEHGGTAAGNLGFGWAISTGSNCSLKQKDVLALAGGWEQAEVQVLDRSRGGL